MGFEAEGHDALVGIERGGIGGFAGGVVVAVFEPVLADAAAGLEEAEREILVELAAVSLGFHDPARAGGVGETGVHAFRLARGDEEGLAGPPDPGSDARGVRRPRVVVVEGDDVEVAAGGGECGGEEEQEAGRFHAVAAMAAWRSRSILVIST